MSKALVDRIPFAKIVTVLAIVFGIALGLCGMNALILSSNQWRGPGEFGGSILTTAAIVESFAIVLSAVALVLTVAAWIVCAILDSSRRRNAEPQKLFDSKDEEEK